MPHRENAALIIAFPRLEAGTAKMQSRHLFDTAYDGLRSRFRAATMMRHEIPSWPRARHYITHNTQRQRDNTFVPTAHVADMLR